MGMSNYGGGFSDGVLIRGIPLSVAHPGKIFWVSNASASMLPNQKTGSDANPGTFNAPFATLDYAIGQCQAGRGDVIMVKPGHSENIGSAGAITSDVSGVAVVGLGIGALRPKFNFTAAAADWNITASNLSFVNLNFVANFADVTSALDVSAVNGLTFQDCYFTEAGTDLNYVDVIDLADGAADVAFYNVTVRLGDAANDSFITGGGAVVGLTIRDSYIALQVAQAAAVGVVETTGNATFVDIRDTSFVSNVDGALFLDFNGAANSGTVTNCYFSSADVAGAVTAGFDFTGGHMFECYVAGEPDSFGLVGGGTVYANA